MLSLAGFADEDQGEPTEKRTRQAEGFYRNLERGVCLKVEKISPKIPEKMDQEKLYAIKSWRVASSIPVIRSTSVSISSVPCS